MLASAIKYEQRRAFEGNIVWVITVAMNKQGETLIFDFLSIDLENTTVSAKSKWVYSRRNQECTFVTLSFSVCNSNSKLSLNIASKALGGIRIGSWKRQNFIYEALALHKTI